VNRINKINIDFIGQKEPIDCKIPKTKDLSITKKHYQIIQANELPPGNQRGAERS
jgi:hypothetical protein